MLGVSADDNIGVTADDAAIEPTCPGLANSAQPRTRRAAWALLARPGHVGSMAASSADDHLTVGGDANVLDSAEQKASAIGLQAIGSWAGVKGTLSACH